MLTGELFEIQKTINPTEDEYCISFRCNSAHPVFKGHFPGNPVLPGVTMVQFVRESMERIFNKTFQLVQSKNIKFVNVVNPEKENILQLTFHVTNAEEGMVDISATIKSDTTSFFQYKGRYQEM